MPSASFFFPSLRSCSSLFFAYISCSLSLSPLSCFLALGTSMNNLANTTYHANDPAVVDLISELPE